MELNYLYKFDVNLLFSKKIENGILKCASTTCDIAREKVSKRDSLLLDQIKQLKKDNTGIEEILVVFDFSEFIKKHSMSELEDINEFEIKIHKLSSEIEEETEITINVVDFLKSNSMSKDCQVYYINSKIEGKNGKNLYNELKERVFFDFDKQDSVLSKLYAYSGTLCSDCILLDDIKLNQDELVVVDDKNWIEHSDCITMISKDFLFNELKKVKSYINENPRIPMELLMNRNACLEFKSLFNSLSLEENNISDELKRMIIEYEMLNKTTLDIFKKELGDLIDKYDMVGSEHEEVKWERMTVKNYPFDLLLFDGEGFISNEFCSEIRASLSKKLDSNRYNESTSFQIRLPYVKGMVHSVDFKGFFKEKGVTEIQHIYLNNGKKYDVNKVKMIITKSQFKMDAFIKQGRSNIIKNVIDYVRLINEYNYSFGVVNANKKEKNYCSLEYQFISTLPLKKNNIERIYNDTKWRINNLCSKENIIDGLMNEDSYWAKKELEMYNFNKDFYYLTKRYKTRKSNTFALLKHKALFSKFDVHGSRRYLSADLLELLYYITFNDYDRFEKDNWLRKNYFYMPSKNPRNNRSIFLRSPHYSRNEIVLLNSYPTKIEDERTKYFHHLTGLVMINPRSLAAERLGGADYDGDTVLVVNDKNIVSSTSDMIKYEDNRIQYKYYPCKIPSLKGKTMKYDNYSDRLQCFQNTFSSRVGQLSNEAIYQASIIYSSEDLEHSKMAEYTILNGLEIDSAKTGKKPKIEFEKGNKDYLFKWFLCAKKEYDDYGTLSNMKSLLNELRNVDGVYDYLYLDEDDGFENNNTDIDSDLIDNFDNAFGYNDNSNTKTKYAYNILVVAYNLNEIELFNNDECKRNKDYYSSDTTDIPRAIAIATIYSNVNKLIRRILSNKSKSLRSKKLNILYNQIADISQKNNIDIDYLLSNLNMNNVDAFKRIEQYVNDGAFHFMKEASEKKKYLKSMFNNINESTIENLSKFNNDGFRLLFIVLNYYINRISRVELSTSIEEKEKIEKKIEYLDKNEKKRFKKLYATYEKHINELLEGSYEKSEEITKYKIIEYLKEEAKTLSFGDVCFAIDNIFESNMIFDVFYDILKDYIGGSNNE